MDETRIERRREKTTTLRLEMVTIAWMIIEAAAAIGAGIAAGSLLLVAFGIDSGIELTSAIVVFRRFRIELSEKVDADLRGVGDVDRKTARSPVICSCCFRLTYWCKLLLVC